MLIKLTVVELARSKRANRQSGGIKLIITLDQRTTEITMNMQLSREMYAT